MGRDSAPVFQSSKHVLNLVTAFLDLGIVRDDAFADLARWDAGFDFFFQAFTKSVGVVAAIRQNPICSW